MNIKTHVSPKNKDILLHNRNIIKKIQVEKENLKLFQFAYDMIEYIENSKESLKLLEIINELTWLQDSRSVHKNIFFISIL